jgi:bleomycin hydrolase
MKHNFIFSIIFIALSLFDSPMLRAQETEKKEQKGYQFTPVIEIPHTPVANQFRSGTCWSFSGQALLEAEILRIKGKKVDLSEMFVVRNAYSEKAKKYVRLHGNLNMAAGGGFSDVIMAAKDYGLMPEHAYPGLVIGEEKHVHGEMDEVFKAYVDAIIKNKNRKLTPVWHKGFEALLDTYLGVVPQNFEWEGKTYTAKSFAKEMGLNPDDYIELTSYTHHPFYQPFAIEIPDNWMWSICYNLPMDELIQVLDHALDKGYTVAWAADVSEKGFSWKNGLAVVPEEERNDLSGTEKERWEALTPAEKQKALYSFEQVVPEKKITQQMRQLTFDNYETTDDHGMLITGTAKDQSGNKFYQVKNSWGTEDHIYHGYLYASVPYVQLKTISIMVHKEAIPKAIQKKLKL